MVFISTFKGIILIKMGTLFSKRNRFLQALLVFLILTGWGWFHPAYAAPADLDTTFNGTGIYTLDLNGARWSDTILAMAQESDGKIVVCGNSGNVNLGFNIPYSAVIARYTSSGALDTTFNTTGIQTLNLNNRNAFYACGIQSDGKIVAAGYTATGFSDNNSTFLVARYNTDGSLDTTTFGAGNGYVTPSVGGTYEGAYAMAFQSDGKIVVGGFGSYLNMGAGLNYHKFALARFNTDGSTDTIATRQVSGAGDDEIHAVAIQTDGKIMVAGVTNSLTNFATARYTSALATDGTFAGGIDQRTLSGGWNQANAIVIQSDGQILVGGATNFGGASGDFALVRYNSADGSLDTTFHPSGGTPGVLTTDFGSGNDQIHALALQLDGKIIAAGEANLVGNPDFAMARYSSVGALDATFGTAGKQTLEIGPGSIGQGAYAMILQSDGKILLGGYNDPAATNNDFALVRYKGSSADFSLTITDSPDPVATNSSLTYTITVTNNGPDATTSTLTDVLPAGVTYVSATPNPSGGSNCAQAAGTVTCTLASLNSGSSNVVTLVVTPTTAGTKTNTPSVTGLLPDGTSGNNSATATTTVQTPGTTISESGGATNVTEGGATDTYTIVLNAPPTSDVTVTASVDAQVTVSPSTLTFTTANYATAQTITVTAVDDASVEGSHTGTITHVATSSDGNYNGIAISNVTANITDNDSNTQVTATITAPATTLAVVGSPITLNGGSSVGATSYAWRITSGQGTLTGATTATPTLTATASGTLIIELSINSGASTTTLTFTASLPIKAITITPTTTIVVGRPITLNGGSSVGATSYAWRITSGQGTLTGETTATPILRATASGTLIVELSVNSGASTTTLTLVAISTVAQETSPNPVGDVVVVNNKAAITITQRTNAQGLPTMMVGSAEILLPPSISNPSVTQYTYAVLANTLTRQNYLVVGMPDMDQRSGRVYFILDPIENLSGIIDLNVDSVLNSNFVVARGGQNGDQFGKYLAAVDTDCDGVDEAFIGAPHAGSNGVIYRYTPDNRLGGTVFGSASKPVSSIVSGKVLTTCNEDLLFGPDNPALNRNLRYQTDTIIPSSGGPVLTGATNFAAASIDLAKTPLTASIGVDESYSAIAVGDVNGDSQDDVVLCSDNGNAYIQFGPVAAGTTVVNNANVIIANSNLQEGFCSTVTVADISGDGLADVLIGAPDYGTNHQGAVYVVFGSRNWSNLIDVSLSGQVLILASESVGDRIGTDILAVDSDQNGTNELYTVTSRNQYVRFDISETVALTQGQAGGGATSFNFLFGGGCQLNVAPLEHNQVFGALILFMIPLLSWMGLKSVVCRGDPLGDDFLLPIRRRRTTRLKVV